MGEYNPHVPQILGQEWVGIKEEAITFSPSTNAVELGHSFQLDTNRQVSQGRFYVKDQPDGNSIAQVYMMNVYPAGLEDKSGPIRRVLIPVNTAAITGTFFAGSAADAPARLLSPAGNNANVIAVPSDATAQKSLALFFNTDRYSQELNGKRIVAVNLLHMLTWNPVDPNTGNVAEKTAPLAAGTSLTLRTGTGSVRQLQYSPSPYFYISGTDLVGFSSLLALPDVAVGLPGAGKISKVQLGDVNYLWSTPSAVTTADVMPWRYEELRRFEATAGSNRYWIQYNFGGSSQWAGEYYLGYAALEVLYCEEQRVIFGGRDCSTITNNMSAYDVGTVIIPLRSASALTTNPVLTPGDYTVTVSSANIGDIDGAPQFPVSEPGANNPYPTLNGLRELYPVSPQAAMQINLEDTEGQVFTQPEQVTILPQLSLHASGGDPLVEVHVYGKQAAAQVYGSITATQEVLDSTPGAASYPWVRFYARRFGDTVVPLTLDSPSIAGSSVSITPGEFDALDEIVDGWKEVTLRFDTPPSMGTGTNPQWRWSATGELSGNRWEVLGVFAPAISGIPGNLINLVPSGQRLSSATYGQPSAGATINLGWVPQYAPPVSATADDQTADAALLFAKDLPTITGFGASVEQQEMTGIGLDCGVDPCCMPTELSYIELSWGLPANTGAALDTFTRTESNGWGTADQGGAYTTSGTAADFFVNGEQGGITFSAVSSSRWAVLNIGAVDFDITGEFTFEDLPATGNIAAGVVGRFTNTSNAYVATARVPSTGALALRVSKFVAGVETILSEVSVPNATLTTNSVVNIRFMGYGTTLKAKIWRQEQDEPDTWLVETTDSSLLTGTWGGVFANDESAVTGHSVFVDNLRITPPQLYFGHYEIQRMDTVDTDWQTIMKATNPSVTGFNDYEARVGILTTYRIRAVDVYDFPGPWSSEVSQTIPEPGITIGCDGGYALIFTSNEQQDGSLNLAYSNVWERGTVEESFVFPEAQFVQLQAMYNKDFFTAFRPTERGGEQFERTVLVQAAAIDPQTLANFTSLRDMAWADVSYICVRDEAGNRWFATVLVPSGRVIAYRRLYLAPVTVIEVTDTPSEVDP